MHLFFPVARRSAELTASSGAPEAASDAGQIFVVRDSDDESEWQYLGNPEIAVKTSLGEAVARFIQDCSGANGSIDPQCVAAAMKLRDALVQAARQIDQALE